MSGGPPDQDFREFTSGEAAGRGAGVVPGSATSASAQSGDHPTPAPGPSAFPLARLRETGSATTALMRSSRLWWLTAGCLLLAFWLTWRSIPATGPAIVIHFPDGHGLKSGDMVRHRGIDVGTVTSVALSDDLTRISATVMLTPGASGLAREGTRFWIVRPQLSLTGVSGLETAVGSKYIAVSPGEQNGKQRRIFDGLTSPPPDQDSGDGLDIVLRSDALHGVTLGAPVTWRGVDVGRILSAGLSPDARFVDIHARIDAEYRRLVRPTSRFWVTSGLGVDVGLSGLKLNADSFSTILRGGVSFTTPAIGDRDETIDAGAMFVLHAKPEDEWLKAATSLPLVDFALPATVTLDGTRRVTTLGIPRTQRFTANGLLLRDPSGTVELLTASDIVPATAEGVSADQPVPADVTLQVSFVSGAAAVPVTVERPASTAEASTGPVHGVRLKITAGAGDLPAAAATTRKALAPEDCCLARSVQNDGKLSSVIQCLAQDELRRDGDAASPFWTITSELGDLTAWHGAPVVSMTDGAIIGVFVSDKSGTGVWCLPEITVTTSAGR